MRNFGLFNISALVASAMVVGIAFVLVPEQSWTTELLISVALFSVSFGFVMFVPKILSTKKGNTDASQMASIGPLSVIAGWLFLLTAAAAAFAIFGFGKIAISLDIFAVGTFIIGSITLRAAINVVADVSDNYSKPSSHVRWQQNVQGLVGLTSDRRYVDALEKLAEKFRYAPSDIPGGTPHDSDLDSAINEIAQSVENKSSDFEEKVKKIEVLMVKRDLFLRTARSKA